MTVKNRVVVLLFLLSFGLMEVHRLVPPSSEKVSLFLASNEVQTAKWYVKDSCNMLITVLILAGVLISLKKSFIKSIVTIVLWFHLFDFAMYWYDFKQTEWIYIIAYIVVSIFVIKSINKWKKS